MEPDPRPACCSKLLAQWDLEAISKIIVTQQALTPDSFISGESDMDAAVFDIYLPIAA